MPEKRPDFLAVAATLFTLAFVGGFFFALATIGGSVVLFKFALTWELTKAALYVAAWAPAVLLAASAIAMESSGASDGFAGAASRVMTPALSMAAIVSIFYILVVPGLEERRNLYESQSQLFVDSLGLADSAYREGRLADAERHLLACAAVDLLDERYVSLNDRVRSAWVKSQAATLSSEQAEDRAEPDDMGWRIGNRFYLEALEARAAGRAFDAHYLAKRSAAIYDKRPEVRLLVEETWRDLQRLGLSAEAKLQASLYKRKLEGYSSFQEGDYLEAYRIYAELAEENADDPDVRAYLERSAEGLSSIAFFIEQDERAFSRSDERGLDVTLGGPGGWKASLVASRAAAAEDGVYFRDLALRLSGDSPIIVRAPFARLHGRTLVLRAVDRRRPDVVWEPIYDQGARLGVDPGFAITVPFDQEDALSAIRLSGAPEDIPIVALATGLEEAERLGIDPEPLKAELADRAAYPFAVMMLVLIGAGLGVRFKPAEPISAATRYLTAPIFVALALPPLRAIAGIEAVLARAFAAWLPGGLFLPAWLGFLSLCVVASLLAAARISGRVAP